MDDDTGSADRSHEPPPLAPVRQLRFGDGEGFTAAGDEWYETERLTGQITGGASTEPPLDRQPPGQDQGPVLLGWRNAQATPAPTALQRLGERLDRRRREPPASRSDVRRAPRGRRVRRAAFPAASNAPSSTLAAPEHRTAAEQNRIRFADDPRTDTREPRERLQPRASQAAQGAIADRRGGQRPLRWALIGAGILIIAAGSLGAVASQLDSTPANPHQSRRVAATRLGAALNTVATTMIGALTAAESHVRQHRLSGRVANRHHSAGVVITATSATTRALNPIKTPAYTPVTLNAGSFSRQRSSTSYRPSTSYSRSSIVSPGSSSSPADGSGAYRQATPSSPTRASAATTAAPRPSSSASNATDRAPGVPRDPPAP